MDEMVDYMTILNHVKEALKPGGRVIIIEKQKNRIIDQSRKSQTDSRAGRYLHRVRPSKEW